MIVFFSGVKNWTISFCMKLASCSGISIPGIPPRNGLLILKNLIKIAEILSWYSPMLTSKNVWCERTAVIGDFGSSVGLIGLMLLHWLGELTVTPISTIPLAPVFSTWASHRPEIVVTSWILVSKAYIIRRAEGGEPSCLLYLSLSSICQSKTLYNNDL